MEILPAIDLMEGRAVRLLRGRKEHATVVGDPLELAQRFAEQGATRLHVVDLDGAFAGAPRHLEVVRQLSQILPVQLGGGIRTPEAVDSALGAGADRLIVGTAAVEDPDLLKAIPAVSLVVGVDVKDGRVAVRGWDQVADVTPSEFTRRMLDQGAHRVLCTAVSRDGTLQGPDLDVLHQVALPGVSLIASGGIGGPEDVAKVATVPGVEAVVVGKALYAGRLTLAEAREMARCQGPAC